MNFRNYVPPPAFPPFWPEGIFQGEGGVYTRETDTIWQTGVLTAERRGFFDLKDLFFGHFALRFLYRQGPTGKFHALSPNCLLMQEQ